MSLTPDDALPQADLTEHLESLDAPAWALAERTYREELHFRAWENLRPGAKLPYFQRARGKLIAEAAAARKVERDAEQDEAKLEIIARGLLESFYNAGAPPWEQLTPSGKVYWVRKARTVLDSLNAQETNR